MQFLGVYLKYFFFLLKFKHAKLGVLFIDPTETKTNISNS